MNHHKPNFEHLALSRREFLGRCGMGMGTLGLASLFGSIGATAATNSASNLGADISPLAPRAPHFIGTAKRVIHIFANGGPSHVDTFDPKPALEKYAGKMLPMENLRTERKTGASF